MTWLVDVIYAFVLLGVVEALIKPLAKRFVERKLIRALPLVFDALDPIMPELLRQYTAAELEDIVRAYLTKFTGDDWSGRNVDAFFERYDPRLTAARFRP